jgi:hypothetical protein
MVADPLFCPQLASTEVRLLEIFPLSIIVTNPVVVQPFLSVTVIV